MAERAQPIRRRIDGIDHGEVEAHLVHCAGIVQAEGGRAKVDVRFPIMKAEVDGEAAEQPEGRRRPPTQHLGRVEAVHEKRIAALGIVLQAMQELVAGRLLPVGQVGMAGGRQRRVGVAVGLRPGNDIEVLSEIGRPHGADEPCQREHG